MMSSTEIPLSNSYPGIKLFKSSVASEAFQQMADSTIYGTPGKMRYAHVKSMEKIQSLERTSFLEIQRNNNTTGIVALVGHTLNVGKQSVSGLYVRYFSMKMLFRSDGKRAKSSSKKNGVLHRMIKEFFDEPKQLCIESIDEKLIIYAFVESSNEHSLNMVKSMGFEPSRELVTLLFSRFYPQEKLEIIKLPDSEKPQIKKHLGDYYKDYNLVPALKYIGENYYIHLVNGEILCGVQLESNTWHIYEMPSIDGRLFRKILPRIPILNRIFQKDKIDFIGIEQLYIKPNHEYILPDFLETLCAKLNVTKAMIGVDNQSPLHHLLKTKGKLGILDKIITPSPGLLFTRTYGIEVKDERTLHTSPFYVSTYDMS